VTARRSEGRFWKVLALAGGLAAAALQGLAVTRQSLTMDEPYHLLAGDLALRRGTNALNLEHPPLVKLVAALPVALAGPPWARPASPAEALRLAPALFSDPALARRARLASRAALALAFGLPWLAACFVLGRAVGGAPTGTVLALLAGLSSAVLPFVSIVQTDAAVALGFALTLSAAWRFVARPSLARAAATGLALGLALAAKFSAVLLLPAVAAALWPWRGQDLGRSRRLAAAACLVGAAVAVPALTYAAANRSYDPALGREAIRAYCHNRATLVVGDRMERWEETLLAVEAWSPGLAQWLVGAIGIGIQNDLGVYPSFAFGEVRPQGRWWYFPAVLAVKTPLPILAASLAALAALVAARRRPGRGASTAGLGRGGGPATAEDSAGELDGRVGSERASGAVGRAEAGGAAQGAAAGRMILAVTALTYLAAAMASSYNLGSRHLLPILPLLYLPAARWAARSRGRALALVGLVLLEAAVLTPFWMSATSTWWLGDANPTRFALGAGDTEYKQNFLALARAAERRGIGELAVFFPGTTSEEVTAYLPGGRSVEAGSTPGPGWYAVTVLAEQTLPAILRASDQPSGSLRGFRALAEEWEPLRQAIAQGEDHGYVAGSFHLYHLPGGP
jgi:hypothetical protein